MRRIQQESILANLFDIRFARTRVDSCKRKCTTHCQSRIIHTDSCKILLQEFEWIRTGCSEILPLLNIDTCNIFVRCIYYSYSQSRNFLISHRNLRLALRFVLKSWEQKCDLGFCTPNQVNMLNHR